MKYLSFVLFFLLLTSLLDAKKPNILFICVDDLRPELGCYGVDYIQSPNIDRLAERGRRFNHHYVQAPTCGASRFALLTGAYGSSGNGALFARAKAISKGEAVTPSLPAWFRENGYTTVSIGKVSHHPGGFGGKDWDDESDLEMPNSWDKSIMPVGSWQHPRGTMHALANGEIRKKASDMDVYQATEGDDNIYPDGLIKEAALEQLKALSEASKPFLLAVGFIRPHLPFGAPAKYLEQYKDVELPPIPHPEKPEGLNTWHKSGEFMKYNNWGKDPRKDAAYADEVRRHYAACVTYVDEQIGQIMAALKADGLEEDTIVVVWGDHGWHLGEHSIWGKHALYEESLRSPLIISGPGVEQPGIASDAVVESVDIYPTLCELAGLPVPDRLDGKSLKPQLLDPTVAADSAVSMFKGRETLRTPRYRLIVHKKGVELYDHDSPEKETRNIAIENPEVVVQLEKELRRKKQN